MVIENHFHHLQNHYNLHNLNIVILLNWLSNFQTIVNNEFIQLTTSNRVPHFFSIRLFVEF